MPLPQTQCPTQSPQTPSVHLETGPGVGVHLALLKSFSLFFPLPSHPEIRSIASALLLWATVPIADLSSSLRAAGVRFPAASDLLGVFGVNEGGAIDPPRLAEGFLVKPGVRATGPPRPSSPALARRLFAALFDSLLESCSREDRAGRWNGVLGGGRDSAGSSDCDIIRGVAFKVPQVISCLTAAGPSSAAVGEGRLGTREKLLIVGDLGRSVTIYVSTVGYEVRLEILHGVPWMAASILLRVGLGGAEIEPDRESSCSRRRVLPYMIVLGSPLASRMLVGFTW